MRKNRKKSGINRSSKNHLTENIQDSVITFQRRGFLKTMGLLGGSTLLGQSVWASSRKIQDDLAFKPQSGEFEPQPGLDLSPAKWLWYPGDRTLPNTFVLFRRVLHLSEKPNKAKGRVIGDSRYLLEVNGRRIQWGPVPNDPRWPEVDPVDLTEILTTGENVIGATVLYFGHGDSTWPMGRAGFIFRMEIEYSDGRNELVVSDSSWRCHLSQAWKPGHHRRWFMGALQEEFDARLHPFGWTEKRFIENEDWIEPYFPPCPANLPIFCDPTNDIITHIHGPKDFIYGAVAKSKMEMRPRSIPMMCETWVAVTGLVEQHRIRWNRPIFEYFAMRPPKAYEAESIQDAQPAGDGRWRVELDHDRGTTLTFALPEQVVGWPGVTIEAPEGTILELMTQDAHATGGPALLNTSHHKWVRFTCREGVNHFQWFDFDCFRWMQVHLHPGHGSVVVSNVGILKRVYPWPHEPRVITSEAPLQKLFDAAANTLRNAAQETFVDGMSRERNQYSGEVSHMHHAVQMLCGGSAQVARFLRTYSQGQTAEGYFLDTWPSVDRLDRLGQRVVEATHCGAILDMGVQLAFDCWHYYEYTGDLAPLQEPYPRLLRLVQYLCDKIKPDDLLPVEQEDYGFPIVYIDFKPAYPKQRHRQCPFNLKVSAMFCQVMAPMCRAFGDEQLAEDINQIGSRILDATIAKFWSTEHRVFIDNLPWWREEGDVHYSDVTLGMSVMFDQCPGGAIERSIEILATKPKNMGLGYPSNICWRLWALGKGGRPEAILKEFREVWAPMESVRLNNTVAEFWGNPKPDTGANWSHCACGPIYIAPMSLAGIHPLAPGFARYEVRPQLADLPDLALTVQTPYGPLGFSGKGRLGKRTINLSLPPDASGELVVHPDEKLKLKSLGMGRFSLPSGKALALNLKYT